MSAEYLKLYMKASAQAIINQDDALKAWQALQESQDVLSMLEIDFDRLDSESKTADEDEWNLVGETTVEIISKKGALARDEAGEVAAKARTQTQSTLDAEIQAARLNLTKAQAHYDDLARIAEDSSSALGQMNRQRFGLLK